MKDISVEKEILDEIHKLGKGQQAEVLEFVRSLAKSELEGVPGKTLLRFAGTIDREDLDKMAEAIQADCETGYQYRYRSVCSRGTNSGAPEPSR